MTHVHMYQQKEKKRKYIPRLHVSNNKKENIGKRENAWQPTNMFTKKKRHTAHMQIYKQKGKIDDTYKYINKKRRQMV